MLMMISALQRRQDSLSLQVRIWSLKKTHINLLLRLIQRVISRNLTRRSKLQKEKIQDILKGETRKISEFLAQKFRELLLQLALI